MDVRYSKSNGFLLLFYKQQYEFWLFITSWISRSTKGESVTSPQSLEHLQRGSLENPRLWNPKRRLLSQQRSRPGAAQGQTGQLDNEVGLSNRWASLQNGRFWGDGPRRPRIGRCFSLQLPHCMSEVSAEGIHTCRETLSWVKL